MSNVQEIESALAKLPLADLQSVRDWLEDFIEDQMEVDENFKAKVDRARQEIASQTIDASLDPMLHMYG